jgi:DNA-directed RNA polymerase subunit RPC12/RpoP
MQYCASCGWTENLRLFEIQDGDQSHRRWWCPECSFRARQRGVSATLCPVWIERAALHLLPMKPVDPPRTDVPMLRFGRRMGDIRVM